MSDEHDREYLEHLKSAYETDDEELIDKLEDAVLIRLCEMHMEQIESILAEGKNITKEQIDECLKSFPDGVDVSLPPFVRKRMSEIYRGKDKGGPPTSLIPPRIFGHCACYYYKELRKENVKRIVALAQIATEFGVKPSRVEQWLAECNKKRD